MSPAAEIARRRTFAIISHPDAGKTTLTEKFLLYGNAIHLAGTVTARKNQRATTSDWMALEKQRGISVSSTVLQFDYNGCAVNLLDTPGHKDFSEDTYRVLTAVDAALMVIDAGKGVEPQTRKLFEVCRRRGIPIFTFMNKCDRPTLDPLALIDELESVLGIAASPVVWPLGNGPSFRGVFDRTERAVHLFERVPNGAYEAPVNITGLDDPAVRGKLDDHTFNESTEQLAMLDGAGHPFDLAAIHAGQQTPVYFGSAINNFGIQLLLDGFLKHSVPPAPRRSVSVTVPGAPAPTEAREVPVDYEKFSGFIFKIQANMDPKHRDRIAFLRVCSGRFTRDMVVAHQRTGKQVRLSSSHKLFGQERETVDEAWPGDVIGLVGHDAFGIGDTLTEDRAIAYDEIPRFPPEVFAYLSNPTSSDAKKYRAGLEQLLQEGVVQSFTPRNAPPGATLLAAVGPLQFEVVQWRLKSEYNAESRLEPTNWTLLKWLEPHPSLANPSALVVASGVSFGADKFDNPVMLFPNDWTMRYFMEKNPDLKLHDMPIEQVNAK
ncbi:peptide chain release factor 3 [Ereboglobus sp. PH5-10]|uniref:peptide chain release factor 3 n=1 Tax=Ereboglobus sp. PH5-10 TaxID=2940629 RepID=UPI00240668DA|nr:peptide chain release factor 3 [Ereboglobus sp. PH5-10]MDF9827180.1 peptide chain release factor 3 [Ereboglobus sp. PH5-10]